MSALLDDIITLAVDGKQSLTDILRNCLLLGHELKNDRLKEWANQELDGYESPDSTPEYRHITTGVAHGHFSEWLLRVAGGPSLAIQKFLRCRIPSRLLRRVRILAI